MPVHLHICTSYYVQVLCTRTMERIVRMNAADRTGRLHYVLVRCTMYMYDVLCTMYDLGTMYKVLCTMYLYGQKRVMAVQVHVHTRYKVRVHST